MPIAKETLRIGFTVVAVEGGYVTKEAVKTYGWQKLVTEGPDLGGKQLDANADAAPAPKKAADK